MDRTRKTFAVTVLAWVGLASASLLGDVAYAQCAGCGADYNRIDRQKVEIQGRPAAQGYIPGRESNENQGRQLKQLDNDGN
jgi:hypothetical protein